MSITQRSKHTVRWRPQNKVNTNSFPFFFKEEIDDGFKTRVNAFSDSSRYFAYDLGFDGIRDLFFVHGGPREYEALHAIHA